MSQHFFGQKNTKYSCKSCDYNTSRKSNFEKHLHSEKHFEKKIASEEAKLLPEEAKFFCEICDFSTSNKKDYKRHCETLKCKSVTKTPKNPKKPQKTPNNIDEMCDATASGVKMDKHIDHMSNTCSVTAFEKSQKIAKKNGHNFVEISHLNQSQFSNDIIHAHGITEKSQKVAKSRKKSQKYHCLKCKYTTCNKSDYNKHRDTAKCKNTDMAHVVDNETTDVVSYTSDNTLSRLEDDLACKCGKTFKERTGLWRHKKTCMLLGADENKLLELVLSKHDETITKLVEMVKDLSKDKSVINTNCGNINNSKFNLNFFLNETCKDAYNISEFVEQLDVSMEDMLNTTRVGYTEGVSQIIVNGLKALDINKRPIHCTDIKRETLYIKENNMWNKEPENRPILLGAVKKIAGKNINQISEWRKTHPDYRNSSSRNNDIHLKMLCNVMQGGTDNEISNSFGTVFRNIAKGSLVPK
jgi:hypothetical protein